MRPLVAFLALIALGACGTSSTPSSPRDAGTADARVFAFGPVPGGGFVPPTKLGTGTGAGGTVTSITAGAGLSGGTITTSGTIALNMTGASCSAGDAVTALSSSGVGTCSAVGTVTSSTLTTGDLAVATGASSLGNYAGSSPSACSTGNVVTDAALSAAGALSLTCTAIGTAGGVTGAGTSGTIPEWNGTTSLTNGPLTDAAGTLTCSEPFSTAGLTNSGAEYSTGIITPTTIAGPSTVNDYNPTGLSGAKVIRQNVSGGSTSAVQLTGVSGGANGRELWIVNISSDGTTLQVLLNNGGSLAANRITWGSSSTTMQCVAGCALLLRYDSVISEWRVVEFLSGYSPATQVGALSVNGVLTTGAANFGTTNSFTATLSPTAIGTDQNDYNPTVGTATLGTSTTLRQDLTANVNLTGMQSNVVSGSTTGRILFLENISSGFTLTLKNENASSSAANRFTLPQAANLTIPAGGAVFLRYSSTTSRWRVIATSGTASGTVNTIAMFTTAAAVGNSPITYDGSSTITIPDVLDMSTHAIHNVVDPTSAQDAATKSYHDTHAPNTYSGTHFDFANEWVVGVGATFTSNATIFGDVWQLQISGTSSAFGSVTGTSRFGVMSLRTGSTSTGKASLSDVNTNDDPTQANWKLYATVGWEALSSATDGYATLVGFFNSVSAVDQTDGCYFLYDERKVASAPLTGSQPAAGTQELSCICASNSVRTEYPLDGTTVSDESFTTVSVPVAAVTWPNTNVKRLEVSITGTTRAEFYVDTGSGLTKVCDINTHIPAGGASHSPGHGILLLKSVGTTSVAFDIDQTELVFDLNSARSP